MICSSCLSLYEGKTTRCLSCVIANKDMKVLQSENATNFQNRKQRRQQIEKERQAKEAIKKANKIASYRAKCPRCRYPVQQGLMNAHYKERHPTVTLLESTEKIKWVRYIQVFSGGLPGLGKRR